MKITINENMRQSAGATGYITQLLSSFADKREALILVYLLANADNKGVVNSSTYAMAIELKIHRQTLSRIINHLAQTGWVSIDEPAPCTPCRDGIPTSSPQKGPKHLMTAENQSTVTPTVMSDVTNDVTLFDTKKIDSTHCVSSECKHSHLDGVTLGVTGDVTLDVTEGVTLDVTTKEEKKLLEKLKAGLLDGRVGRDLETSGGSTIWTMIKNGLPGCYKEGPGGRFFNGKENERYSGKRHILTEYKTDEQKLFFLKKFGWLLDDEEVRAYSKKFKGKGNNPWPLKKEGRCCDECNKEVVEAKNQYIEIQKIIDTW